jgi:non-canonical purine NTP pyrophosphatase (RdgB/HAM1 family)
VNIQKFVSLLSYPCLVLATNNPHKIKEIQAILGKTPIPLKTLNDFPPVPPVEETGTTYEENALLKGSQIAKALQLPVLADDSGLEIEVLGGKPGVHSSRYLGEKTSYKIKNEKILKLLKGMPPEKKKAKFVCCAVLVFPSGETKIAQAEIWGRIADAPKGENGFGYDPIFFLPDFGKTMAELSFEEKNRISHRAQAFKKLFTRLGAQ